MIPSVKRLSTREEELYKAQINQLQFEVHCSRVPPCLSPSNLGLRPFWHAQPDARHAHTGVWNRCLTWCHMGQTLRCHLQTLAFMQLLCKHGQAWSSPCRRE